MSAAGGPSNPKVVSFLRGKPKATDATLQLVADLKRITLQALSERLDAMFEGADDLLFEFAERASNNNDRRLFFDAMRTIRLGRKNLVSQFVANMETAFLPASAAPLSRAPALSISEDEMELQNPESLELGIAISNMVSKADGLFKQAIWEIDGRLQTLVSEQNAPIARDAFSPATICKSLRQSVEAMEVEFAVELVIFKLFDRLVIGELGELYNRVLQFLKQNGLRAPPLKLSPSTSGNGIEAVRPTFSNASLFSSNPMAMPPPAPPQAGLAAAMMMSPALDQQTLSSLQRMQFAEPPSAPDANGAAVYSNSHLAADLAAASQGQAILGWGAKQTTAYMQRASLVGHMFNDILSDPYLPAAIRGQFDALRMATIKVALKDLAFVSDPDHPVRGLINELASMATTARATSGEETLARISELCAQIQKQFDVAAETLRKPSADIELLDTEQAERFIEQQAAQTTARRQVMVKKVRKVIAEELQLRTRGTTITDELKPLLHSAWAPMMAMQLLQSGPESEPWQEGLRLLDRILRSLDRNHPEARAKEQREALFADLSAAFSAVSLGGDRISSALQGLDKALDAIVSMPVESSAGDGFNVGSRVPPLLPTDDGSSDLLEMLLQPGAWFLVHDNDRPDPRWMKAVAYYGGLDCGAFAEFDGGNTLIVKSRVLLDDLAARRTIPVDLGPTAKDAFERFLARAA